MIVLILLSQATQAFYSVPIETPCSSSENCGSFAICVKEACECVTGFRFVEGNCTSTNTSVDIGSRCDEATTCGGGSICIDAICSCVDGQQEQNGICSSEMEESFATLFEHTTPPVKTTLPKKPVIGLAGMPCGISNACRPMSTCRDDICQCRNGYVASFGECIRDLSIRRSRVKPLPVNGG